MSAAVQVSLQTRVASVWTMVLQPHVKVTGTWRPCKQVYVRAGGVWRTSWADIAREGVLGNRTSSAFDLVAPFDTHAGFRLLANGDLQQLKDPPSAGYASVSSWRNWIVNDREWEARFERVSGTLDIVPTEDAWIALTSPATTRTVQNDRTTSGSEVGIETVKIRETVTAPAGGDDQGNWTVDVENGTL